MYKYKIKIIKLHKIRKEAKLCLLRFSDLFIISLLFLLSLLSLLSPSISIYPSIYLSIYASVYLSVSVDRKDIDFRNYIY